MLSKKLFYLKEESETQVFPKKVRAAAAAAAAQLQAKHGDGDYWQKNVYIDEPSLVEITTELNGSNDTPVDPSFAFGGNRIRRTALALTALLF